MRAIVLATCLVMASLAAAQEITGTIEGSIDGEPLSWVTMTIGSGEDTRSSATWDAMGEMLATIRIDAYLDLAHDQERALSIQYAELGGFPSGCSVEHPCVDDSATITFWTSSSLTEDFYQTHEGVASLTRFEEVSEGEYRIEGTFSGVLGFVASMMRGERDDDDQVQIEGQFAIDRVMPVMMR